MTMTTTNFLLLAALAFLLLGGCTTTTAFAPMAASRQPLAPRMTTQTPSSSSSLAALLPDHDLSGLAEECWLTAEGLLHCADDLGLDVESEVLQDASHVFLDFSVFVTENKPLLKAAQIVGRLLVLATDYLPDRHIAPEELGVQLLMMGVCVANSSLLDNGTNKNTNHTSPAAANEKNHPEA